MIRRQPDGVRLTFLGKFVLATFVLYIAVSSVLAHVLIDRHESAVETNEGTNAAGQISALATPVLALVPRSGALPRAVAERLHALDDDAKRLEFVDGIRIYNSDGSALYPAAAQADRAAVVHTLATATLWSKNGLDATGESVATQFVPFVGPTRIFVIAIDLSRDALRRQASGEAEGVLVSTAIAIGLVFVALVALAAGASHEIERRRRESEQTFVQILGVLAETIDKRDPYTAGHSRRVAAYSRMLARALGFSDREQSVIEHAALLHDVGKIGIPDAVLLKPDKLDPAERAIISNHPRIGADILSGIASMEDVVPCVLHHHERIDGSGYPDRLAGDVIPRGARVIAVADTFDAMTTDRPYRRALSSQTAITEMRRVAATQLQPEYVEAFVALILAGRVVPPSPAASDVASAAVFASA